MFETARFYSQFGDAFVVTKKKQFYKKDLIKKELAMKVIRALFYLGYFWFPRGLSAVRACIIKEKLLERHKIIQAGEIYAPDLMLETMKK